MRLPRTITLPARKALMALPYWPEPPGPALMSSMRLSATSVPSSPIPVRRISMPLSLVPTMVLRETLRPLASNDATAVEGDASEANRIGAVALDRRGPASEDEFRRAAYADQLHAIRQPQQSAAVDTGRQRQRHLRPRSLVDGALKRARLVLVAAGPHAILGRIAAEQRRQRRRARGIGRHGQRTGDARGRSSDKMTAVEIHDASLRRTREMSARIR